MALITIDFLSILQSTPQLLIITLITLVAPLYLYSNLKPKDVGGKSIPSGSFGIPLVGESVSFLRARGRGKVEEWLESRVRKHGAVFKTSLFGSKVVVVSGLAGSRLVFQGGDNGISCRQPETIAKILGRNNLFELHGDRYKLIRGAIVGFLKPDSIRRFVSRMDLLVHQQLEKEIDGKECVVIVELMKKIAFNVAWSIFFGFPNKEDSTQMLEHLKTMLRGAQSIPLNIPGTTYHKGIKACTKMREHLAQLIKLKKNETVDPNDSILSALLHLRDEKGEPLSEEEILDNFVLLIFGSHDTIAVLTTLFIRHLARDDQVYHKVLQEQMEVMKAKRENSNGVNWKEIQMMKYTWEVAQELMRFHSPNPLFFRQTTRDLTFQGFHIPKGWQVLLFPSSTHMDEKIFKSPKEFDPSRFEISTKSYPPYSYIAFGAGPRVCPGAEFGKIETLLVIHHLVTQYQWKQIIQDEPIALSPVPYPAMGLPVKFHLRN